MKFKILIEHEDQNVEPWWEEYNQTVNNCEKWEKKLVEQFNKTLRPYEKPRRFIRAEIIDSTEAIL